MLRLSRKTWIQLAVLSLVTVVSCGAMAFNYMKLPETLFGIGQYDVTVDLKESGGLYQNSVVTYRGTETSIDGGTGTNTLVMKAAATVNLANLDQTTADTTNVANFQNVDASALSTAVSITGSTGPSIDSTRIRRSCAS